MLPYCILPLPNKKTKEKGVFFHFCESDVCFEHFFLKSELTPMEILREYPLPFPNNIKKQLLQEYTKLLQTLKKEEITHCEPCDCCKSTYYAKMTMKWINENKNPKFEKWLIKMLQIFILGMHPNIEKRKKGKEFENMVYSHFYDVYNYRDVYQDFNLK
jgi:hypothetical protein